MICVIEDLTILLFFPTPQAHLKKEKLICDEHVNGSILAVYKKNLEVLEWFKQMKLSTKGWMGFVIENLTWELESLKFE